MIRSSGALTPWHPTENVVGLKNSCLKGGIFGKTNQRKATALLLLFLLVGSQGSPTVYAVEPPAFGESPDLAQLVAEGRLPPVEERLPVEPMVIDTID